MISLPSGTRIWLVAGATDMRKSFNGLGEQIHHVLDEDPFSGHLFIFRGRRGDTVKILWADADGLCLFIKRPEGTVRLACCTRRQNRDHPLTTCHAP